MEKKEEQISINFEKQLNLSTSELEIFQRKSDYTFPKKKSLSKEEISKTMSAQINLITNFSTYNLKKIKFNLCIYAITVEDISHKTQSILFENFQNKIINSFKTNPNVLEKLKKNFKDFIISGNSLFGEPIIDDQDEIVFYFKYDLKEPSAILSKEIFNNLKEKEEYKSNIYIVRISQRIVVKDADLKLENPHLKKFVNLSIKRALNKLNYFRTDPDNRSIYFKTPSKASKYDLIEAGGDKYFFPGYKIVSNAYENQAILLKTVPKFRLIRQSTYMDYYIEMLNKYSNPQMVKEMFAKICTGRKGFKTYQDSKFTIDEVIFASPGDVYFMTDDDVKMNLIEYFYKRWNISNISNKVQPIFVNNKKKRNFQTGEREIKPLYYLPQFTYVVGIFSDERINAKILKQNPEKKLLSILDVMKGMKGVKDMASNNIEDKYFNTDLDFKPVKLNAYVMNLPNLEVKSSIIKPKPDGSFQVHGNEPKINNDLKKWLVLMYDVTENEGNLIFNKMTEAAKAFNMKLDKPDVMEIEKKKFNQSDFEKYFDDLFNYVYQSEQKKRDEDKYELIAFFCSNKEDLYAPFKKSINESKLTIPSQFFKKEKALTKSLSYYTNILIQIWAKRDLPIWFIPRRKEYDNTIVISYAVNKNPNTGKNVTSLSISYTKYFESFLYLSSHHESGAEFMSNIIYQLVTKAIDKCFKMDLIKKKWVSNIIVYREGLNESQRNMVIKFELDYLNKAIADYFDKENNGQKIPRLCFIFVNNTCETRLFNYIRNSSSTEEGIEKYVYNPKEGYVSNVPVGTLVDGIITSDNVWEFYINSTYTAEGTNIPTFYIVGFNNTNLEASAIYSLTFNLAFGYFNTEKSIRFPSPLHQVIRLNKFIIANNLQTISRVKPFNYSL